MKKGYLVLQDGQVLEGERFGAETDCVGELVFTTGMCGYLETLTDPSYAGQIVVQTFPLIGNYGVIPADFEGEPHVRGYIVRACCDAPSNFRSDGTLDAFLKEKGIPGLCGVDTRRLTRTLRDRGVMNAMLCSAVPEDLSALAAYRVADAVAEVTCAAPKTYTAEGEQRHRVALLDYGMKRNILRELQKRGCAVQTGAMVERVEQTAQGLCVFYTQKGKPGQAVGEMVLCAIGRKPYTENLLAPGLELAQERGRLLVDASFQTSVPGIYAIGDVSSRVQLAHVASAQGVYCVEKLYGAEPTVDLSVVPGCVYTRPEIASVGLSEQEAKAAGIAVKTGKGLTSANARSVIAGADRGFLKLVARADTGAIIGAHLMCDRATDMISELSQAIADARTAQDLLHIIRPHPTFEEALHDALTALVGK